MTERRRRASARPKIRIFPIFMVLYAVAALIAIGYGLNWFNGFIGAYEDSLPKHVLDAYMENLTPERVAELSADLIAKVDHNLQSEEECRAYIEQALSGGLQYAKKSSESTEEKQVYVLRAGMQVIGSFTMETTHEDEYGFDYWEVTDETIDMSYLLGQTVTVQALDSYPVTINGVQLNSTYVVGQPQKLEALKSFYSNYSLPVIVTYQAGPFLGELDVEVTDPEGNPFSLEDVEDLNTLAENCSEETITRLDSFVDDFINRYVTFCGGSNKDADANLNRLLAIVVPNSDFASRMYGAWYGQKFTQSWGDRIVEIRNNYFFQLDDGTYMCDVTYLVDTTGYQGVVRTTNNVRIVIVKSGNSLKVQAVYNYAE